MILRTPTRSPDGRAHTASGSTMLLDVPRIVGPNTFEAADDHLEVRAPRRAPARGRDVARRR